MLTVLRLAVVCALVAGCGAERKGPREVEFRRELEAGSAYIEGSAWVLRVEQGELKLADLTLLGQDTIRLRIDNGTYSVSSAQRPCEATCSQLDPERDRCAATVRVDDDTRGVVTTVQAGRGCSIATQS